jgi:hypothetical protein
MNARSFLIGGRRAQRLVVDLGRLIRVLIESAAKFTEKGELTTLSSKREGSVSRFRSRIGLLTSACRAVSL